MAHLSYHTAMPCLWLSILLEPLFSFATLSSSSCIQTRRTRFFIDSTCSYSHHNFVVFNNYNQHFDHADEDAWFAFCGVCCGWSDCSWKFADTWPAHTMVLCRVLELRFSCLNVRLAFVCYRKFPQKCLQIFSKCAAFLIAWLVLFLQNLVIRTKSVEFMPFYLSLSTFLMSASFLLYGLFNSDAFVYVSYSSTVAIAIFQFIH